MSGDDDGTVRRWDALTGKSIGEPMYGHSEYATTIVISDDGKLIDNDSLDKTVRQWDDRNGEAIGKPMEHSNEIADLVISTGGCMIVSGDVSKNMLRWNAKTGEKLGYHIKASQPKNLVIRNIEKIIACGLAYDGYVEQWSIETG